MRDEWIAGWGYERLVGSLGCMVDVAFVCGGTEETL